MIEDTHLTLAVIPYKVEANDSSILLPLQTYEKKNCRASVPLQSISPWVNRGTFPVQEVVQEVQEIYALAKYDTKDKFSNLKIKQFQAKTNNHIGHIYQDLITHDNGSVLAAFVVVITVQQ